MLTNSNSLLVSVIVPVYNVEPFLRQCLDSIIGQTYPNLEIILVDDGSTDNSGRICDEYGLADDRIKVVHKANGGLSSARNSGLSIANGDYIAFVDSDDWLDLNAFDLCNVHIVKQEYPDILMYGYRRVTPSETYDLVLSDPPADPKGALMRLVNTVEFIPSVWSRIFKRSLICNLNFFEGRVYEDVPFSLCAHMNARSFSYLPQTLYNYRSNVNSISYVMKENIIDLYCNLQDVLYIIKESDPKLIPIVNATRIRWLQAHYEEIKSRGLKPERFKPIFRDMRKFPFSYTNWKNFLARWAFIHFPNLYTRIKQLLRK